LENPKRWRVSNARLFKERYEIKLEFAGGRHGVFKLKRTSTDWYGSFARKTY